MSSVASLSPSQWSPTAAATLFVVFLSLSIFTAIHWGFPGAASFFQQELSWNGIGGSRTRSSEPRSQKNDTAAGSGGSECPEYFRWIHEDLRPWKGRGISRELVEDGRRGAYFRLVVVKGEVYVDKYKRAYQTRDTFNIWGILQLLRLYPGKLPDLDLMFSCDDWPAIHKSHFEWISALAPPPPPMFGYCGNDRSAVVRFPDWSFWGWPEVHIEPWEALKNKLEAGNKEVNWTAREPYAYWKGNTRTGTARRHLCRCNVTDQKDWNARIYHLIQDLRGRKHVWIGATLTHNSKWGDWQAQKIGEAANKFIMEELKMKNVYDYMFHLLSEYAKLLSYRPTVPQGAVRVCTGAMDCVDQEDKTIEGLYKMGSMVQGPSKIQPCKMLPPYDPPALKAFLESKEKIVRQVQRLEERGNFLEDLGV